MKFNLVADFDNYCALSFFVIALAPAVLLSLFLTAYGLRTLYFFLNSFFLNSIDDNSDMMCQRGGSLVGRF